jgi:proteasome chaperone 2
VAPHGAHIVSYHILSTPEFIVYFAFHFIFPNFPKLILTYLLMTDCLNSSILVIPAVSSGNVPQLAVDLLIHTLQAPLITRLGDEHVYPIAGARDVPSGCIVPSKHITTPVEVYHSNGITFIQIRSPTLPGQRSKFVEETILPFISKHNFNETIVVGSASPGYQSHPGSFRFKVYSDSAHGGLVERLKLLKLDHDQTPIEVEKVPNKLNESGIIVDVLRKVSSACGIVMFAYEGDNFQDGEELAEKLVTLLNIKLEGGLWKRPESWKGAYGREVPIGLEEGLYS